MKELKYMAIAGNVVFILWIVYNGIDESVATIGRVEAAALLFLVALLALNAFLLIRRS